MDSPSENEQSRGIKNTGNKVDHKISKSELLASAKVVADAARNRRENKVDKAEVAGAAANLLHAASEYGKFEDKNLGKVMAKAENHLRQYHTSHSSTAAHHHSSHSTSNTTSDQIPPHSSTNQDHEGHSGSGGKSKYGEYVKLAEELAEGVLKKNNSGGGGKTETSTDLHQHGGHSGSGGNNNDHNYGQYVKMAGDFLKKH
ncbi:hypothetical protein M9H77_09899 [Catharanthus roseus]|uniref:Uncharacterized protein n=1 Tax=Catharanthus roseus TaxID=4058 RepID=A0ACC0C1X6_CATRO|nr:hypothetical protein M9H77_09899 [Catharanthus roseus]